VTTVGIRPFCEALYCTHAAWEAFTATADRRIAFTAVATTSGHEDFYLVEFDDVRDFSWREDNSLSIARTPPRPHPDDRLELSDVGLERERDGWRFWCEPWYCRVIEFRCATIRLNGVLVVGEGKWLQDELPGDQPSIPPSTRV